MTPRIGAAVLASGRSRRFKDGDKLLHPFRGHPLCAHIARTLSGVPLTRRVAICPKGDAERAQVFSAQGFAIAINADPDAGMGHALALAAQDARGDDLDGLLVCLADMPLVTQDHLSALLAQWAEADRPQALASQTEESGVTMPPVLFSATAFETLSGLSGDRGARMLLADAPVVRVAGQVLADFDTVADFASH